MSSKENEEPKYMHGPKHAVEALQKCYVLSYSSAFIQSLKEVTYRFFLNV